MHTPFPKIRIKNYASMHTKIDLFLQSKMHITKPCAKRNYLCTLAPAPFTMFSTSLRDAMEVSPGVVIASAPWATP